MKLTNRQGIIFLLTAFLLSGCGLFENEQPEDEIERTYTKTIERDYSNQFERALIDSAEAVYPPRDSVVAVLNRSYPNRNYDEILPEIKYWHYNSFDGILLPYSLTIDALNYYSSLIDSMRTGATYQFITKANFKYYASISFEEVYEFEKPEKWTESVWLSYLEFGQNPVPSQIFENIYVVEMYLEWDNYCSEVCGLYFTHLRIVLFNQNGDLIGAFLDGNWYPILVS